MALGWAAGSGGTTGSMAIVTPQATNGAQRTNVSEMFAVFFPFEVGSFGYRHFMKLLHHPKVFGHRTAIGQATYPSEFRLDWCVGEQCFDHSISCAQFQMRLKAYYKEQRYWMMRYDEIWWDMMSYWMTGCGFASTPGTRPQKSSPRRIGARRCAKPSSWWRCRRPTSERCCWDVLAWWCHGRWE